MCVGTTVLYVCRYYWDICGTVQLGHVHVGTIVLYVCRYYRVICV